MENRVARLGLWSACLLIAGALVAVARGQGTEPADAPSDTIRDGFETPKIAWRQEQTDATVKIFAHERTNRRRTKGCSPKGFSSRPGSAAASTSATLCPRSR